MSDLAQRIAALTPEQRQALLAKLKAAPAGPKAAPIPRRTSAGPCRASSAQERMWFLHKLYPASDAYNGSTALHLTGPLDLKALERSLASIVRRHEVLRSTFDDRDGQLLQIPAEHRSFHIRVIDVSDEPESSRSAASRQCLSEEARRPFDLGADLLLRAAVIRLAADEHILLLTAHHIASDGWSVEPLVRELSAFYAAYRSGGAAPVPELSIQYADFADWERRQLTGESFQKDLDYWRRRLAGLAPLALATDRKRPAVATLRGAPARLKLSRELSSSLRGAARSMNATLFMTMLAGFKALLFRQTGQTDLAVGLPIANRGPHELEDLIGFFANLVVLRTEVTGSLRFCEVVERVRETALSAYEHQHVPFERLVEELSPSRDVDRNPLAQVAFVVQNATFETLKLADLSIHEVDLRECTTRFDLELHAWDRADGIELVATYSPELFDASTIERLLTQYQRLLAVVVAAPQVRVESVVLVDAHERAALIAGGTGTVSSEVRERTLGEAWAAQMSARPEALALEDGASRWTYAEAGAQAAQLAGVLRAAGVGPNVTVGVWLPRGADLMLTLLGITVAGGAYVPLDPTQPRARAAAMWGAVGVRVVVTDAAGLETVPSGAWTVVSRRTGLPSMPIAPVTPWGTSGDLAYVLFTSGSTGQPKGVAVPQRAVLRLVREPDYVSLGPLTVMGQAATAAFDAATFEIWGAWLNGGRLVILPAPVVVSPAALGDAVRKCGVTTLFLTTALVHQIGREAPAALAGLDTLLFGGEAVEPRWVAALQAAGGPRRLVHVYGPTEVTTFATWHPLGQVEADAVTLPIGGPIVDTQAYVLDASGAIAPVGAVGELYLGGAGLAHGYVGEARLTAEKFVPDGVSGSVGSRLYRTGDLVRWNAPGTLLFVGRRDGQLKLRGYRIEIAEVEAALAAVAGVGASVVVVDGTGSHRRLVGYVAPAPAATVTAASVREALKVLLPAYMVPAALAVLESLPLNANGKVDRRALPKPEATGPETGQDRAPRGEVEALVAAVWRQVLQVDAVGVDENFFDAGGHSLLLVRVQAGLETALAQRVPLVTLFQFPTIASLAAHLTGVVAPQPVSQTIATPPGGDAIAVIGMAGRFPGAPDIATWWARLCAGDELLHRFSDQELAAAGVPASLRGNPRYVPVRGIVDAVDQFDAGFFGFAPRDAALLDPQQRVLLECAWTTLEAAGYPPATSSVRVGVYAGSSLNTYSRQPMGHDATAAPDAFEWVLASSKDFLATRVSYKLRLTGPSVTVQTACSTSLVAVHAACQALKAGECEVALAGGVSVTVPDGGYLYHPDGIASPDGHCRPFDAAAAGTVAGNGVALVALKPLRAALADGDRIHAVIRGTAINNDGADKVGFTAPGVHGQAAVIAAAQAAAGVDASAIGYVEAHGTGTPLGDPVEVAALRQVFGEGAGPATCGLGSVKGNVGHLDAAAGVTGLIKTVLALEHGVIPPSLHFTAPPSNMELGPFFVPTTLTPWPKRTEIPRRAAVSSFGMGGTNAHAILEEAPALTTPLPGRGWHVLPVSGSNPDTLEAAAAQLADLLESVHAPPLADAAYTAQIGRVSFPFRRVAVGQDAASVARALRVAPDVRSTLRPSLIWMFPGQGTAVLGQGAALLASEPVFRAELEACATVVAPLLGGDLCATLYPPDGRAAALDPVWTQVGLVAIELGLAALWRSWGLTPTLVLGHSVGELAAAVVAGVLTRSSALTLTVRRAQGMVQAPVGGMLAVAADVEAVTPWLGNGVTVAAINGPKQTVVAGPGAGVAAVAARLAAAALPTQPLATHGAFHSSLMAEVVAPLTAVAVALPHDTPRCVWVSSVTGARLEAVDPTYWGAQVTAPVQWMGAVATAWMLAGAAPVWLEVGPGHTLTNLMRAGQGETAVASLSGANADEAVARAVGALWAAGCAPDWAAYHAGERRQRVDLPTYPFQRQRYWINPPTSAGGGDKASGPLSKNTDASQWFYVPTWNRAPLEWQPDPMATPRRRVVVFADRFGHADRAIAQLESEGHSVVRVEPGAVFARFDSRYVLDPRDRRHYCELFAGLPVGEASPIHLLHYWCLDSSAAEPPSTTIPDGFWCALDLIQALISSRCRAASCSIITARAQDVTGEEPVDPKQAAVLGLLRVAALEHPGVRWRAVDVPAEANAAESEWLAHQMIAELLSDSPDLAVAYRGRYRWIERFASRRLPAADRLPRRLRIGGVYLITGGLGKIGMALADFLIRSARATVILVGRREPTGAVAGRLQRWRDAGADVVTLRADVADAEEMSVVLDEIDRRHGALSGVIHAAGLTQGPSFASLDALDHAAFEQQFRPKVEGVQVLAKLLDGRPLDFCVLMSSLSTTLGGFGFGAYASANACLDAFASARSQATTVPWMSVAWEGWHFDADAASGATAQLAATVEEGVDAFARVLNAAPLPRTIVSTADLDARIAQWFAVSPLVEAARTDTVRSEAMSARPGDVEFVAPANDTERAVAAIWESLLGIRPIGGRDDFFALGGHSLLGTQLMSRVRETFSVDLSLTALFTDPHVSGLSARIDQRRADLDRGRNVAAHVERLRQMSPEERKRLLDEARRSDGVST